MSIADEIRQLKELLDSGVLTSAEFERSKQALLSKLTQSPSSELSQKALVGRWKLKSENMAADDEFELSLLSDGCAKVIIASPSDPDMPSGLFGKTLGLHKMSGIWWVEGQKLMLSVKPGNLVFNSLYRFIEKAEMSKLELALMVESISQHVIAGKDDAGYSISLSRVGIA